MIIRVIDEKIKQNQELKEYYKNLKTYNLEFADESIIRLINMAINDLETIKFLYLHELKDKENIKND